MTWQTIDSAPKDGTKILGRGTFEIFGRQRVGVCDIVWAWNTEPAYVPATADTILAALPESLTQDQKNAILAAAQNTIYVPGSASARWNEHWEPTCFTPTHWQPLDLPLP